MAYNLKNRNFLKLLDFTPKEISFLLDLSFDLKKAKYTGTEQPRLAGNWFHLIHLNFKGFIPYCTKYFSTSSKTELEGFKTSLANGRSTIEFPIAK